MQSFGGVRWGVNEKFIGGVGINFQLQKKREEWVFEI